MQTVRFKVNVARRDLDADQPRNFAHAESFARRKAGKMVGGDQFVLDRAKVQVTPKGWNIWFNVKVSKTA